MTKQNSESQNLYKFHWDCGRMGEVSGVFIATQADVNKAIGNMVYLGEVLGKHSEVFGKLETDEVTRLDVSSETVSEILNVLGPNVAGYNPLDYIEEGQ